MVDSMMTLARMKDVAPFELRYIARSMFSICIIRYLRKTGALVGYVSDNILADLQKEFEKKLVFWLGRYAAAIKEAKG